MSRKSIPKNMIMSTILTVSNFLFPLITYGYVSRVLGAAGTGQVAFVRFKPVVFCDVRRFGDGLTRQARVRKS